jgi:hypothetical protein
LLSAFRGERASIEDCIGALQDGLLSRDKLAESALFTDRLVWINSEPLNTTINHWIGADFRLSNATAKVKHLTWIIERLKESPDGLQLRSAEWEAMRSQLRKAPAEDMEGCSRFIPDMYQTEARLRCAALAIAAERYRRANGHWPRTLDELTPAYLAEIPRDPFDGKPLKLARRVDGIVIYSISSNGIDDRGDTGDVGIRLWDVKQRRQPPVPKKPPEKQDSKD